MTSVDLSVEPAVERRLQLDMVEARFLEAGEGIPTICIHGVGYTNGADSWLPAIREGLADGLHIFAIDQIGWGMGSRMDFEYSISYLADHVREIQDNLGYARTNIIGHSLGGWIAATFAYESPNRVRKLVLDSIAGMNPTPPDTVSNFQVPDEEAVKGAVKNQFRAQDQEQMAEFYWRNAQQPGAEAAFRQITKHLNDPAMRRRYYLKRKLSKIQVPTLVTWGDQAPPLFPLTAGQEIAALVPGAEMKVIPGAGHFTMQGWPAEFVELARPFLLSD